MLTNLYVSLALVAGAWTSAGGGESPLATLVAVVKVLSVTAAAIGFLFLAARVSRAAQQFVATCQERQRTQRKLVELLGQYLEQPPAGPSEIEQMWSASAAMAVC